MRFRAIQNNLIAVVALAMVSSLADPAAIGIATSSGHFRVDNNKVLRNATVFEGTAVETGDGSGQLRLAATSVAFDANTRGTVYKNRVVLDRGKIQWTGGPAFRAEAGAVQIIGDSGTSKAIVLKSGAQVQVASLGGTVSVRDAAGALVSTVAPGTAMAFVEDQAGAQTSDTSTTTNQPPQANDQNGPSKKKIAIIALGASAAVAVPVAIVATNDKCVSGCK